MLRCFRLREPDTVVADELYYVNAARNILGHHDPGSPFVAGHPGLDVNTEHPPLVKLILAGSMRLLGDNPLGWRLPSIIFGTAAILLIYWLVRSAGGGPAPALVAAALMATDNLLLVHSRMATLDIFVLVFMLLATTLYLRGRWLGAGAVAGVATCAKLVGGDVLLVLALLEWGRHRQSSRAGSAPPGAGRAAWLRLATVALAAAASYAVLLSLMDLQVSSRDPLSHTVFMLVNLGGHGHFLTFSRPGISVAPDSAPWQWLVDQVPIPYFRLPSEGPARIVFTGVITPAIAFAAVPTLLLAVRAWRRGGDQLSLLALAWFAGTIAPFTVGAALGGVTYLYYMVVVMPGIYIAIARVLASPDRRLPPALRAAYGIGVLVNFALLYPFRTLN